VFKFRAFEKCSALTEAIFPTETRLRAIPALIRIEIPAAVEGIGSCAFKECSALTEVLLGADRQLGFINGFQQMLNKCSGPTEVVFAKESRLRLSNPS
jgi:hypothetical protein